MDTNEPEDPTTAFPSVDLAYDIAVSSYDVSVKRIEWIDGRLQALLTFAVTVGGAVAAASRGLLPFRSVWFYLAVTSFSLATLVGFYARFTGTIRVLDPAVFYDRWLHRSNWEFKKDLIYFAGQDFTCNIKLSERIWYLSIVVLILFFLEVAFLVLWVAKAHV